ncbi:MAG TPA: NTP transferase domain-containing protein, partial [Candidatus Baltobacteraceae bacterium]|nr:NTP transferase domain-containing protein [Candidatus Baltobacteraceae bacterium]
MRALTDSDVLIMAGGRSQRMRRSAGAAHKALVSVLGVPMIERNLRYVLESGFRNVVVAINALETELAAYLERVAADLARSLGGRCETLIEDRPLGTIGAAREVQFKDALLVVNVDNLTALSLTALLDHHRRAEAA